MVSPNQPFVTAFLQIANQSPEWAWNRYTPPGHPFRRFVVSISVFSKVLQEVQHLAIHLNDRHHAGPALVEIIAEPFVLKVEDYVVTVQQDARITLDGVYFDAKAPIYRVPLIAQWIDTANEDDIEGSFRRLWWD